MEGPQGGTPRRTAGESRGTDPSGGPAVREWQRNTWYGPAPVNMNPFEEPDTAPELRNQRSENVNQHVGDFWGDNAAPAAPVLPEKTWTRRAGDKRTGTREASQKRSLWKSLFVIALVVAATLAVLRFAVFSVREINVTGNRELSAEDVISLSGIRPGDNILTLSSDRVEQRLSSDWRIQFRYLHKSMPGSVTIAIREREESCWLIYCGIQYVTDKNGVILEETENTAGRDDLVQVKGLDIRSGCSLGQTLVLNSALQQMLFRELFLEMRVIGCSGIIAEADISNPSSILLLTRDGITVNLGDYQDLHAKLRAMLLVREAVLEMNYSRGSINVSNPVTPFYSPGEKRTTEVGN